MGHDVALGEEMILLLTTVKCIGSFAKVDSQSINQSIKFYICVPSLARLIRCLDKFILAYVHVGGLISTDASTWDDKAGMLPPLQRPLLDIAAKVDGGPGHHRWVDEAQPLT